MVSTSRVTNRVLFLSVYHSGLYSSCRLQNPPSPSLARELRHQGPSILLLKTSKLIRSLCSQCSKALIWALPSFSTGLFRQSPNWYFWLQSYSLLSLLPEEYFTKSPLIRSLFWLRHPKGSRQDKLWLPSIAYKVPSEFVSVFLDVLCLFLSNGVADTIPPSYCWGHISVQNSPKPQH